MSRAHELALACRVTGHVPLGESGLWITRELELPTFNDCPPVFWPEVDKVLKSGLDPGDRYTVLQRATQATLHTQGEVVMEDTLRELKRHLPILLPARGRVLVSGLGLGCVVRGLLSKPEVEHVDVVEICPDILKLVGPAYEGLDRLTIHQGDALTIRWPRGKRWDFAWHDVWVEEGKGSLDVLHAHLMKRYKKRATRQGAWAMPRMIREAWRRNGVHILEGRAA